MKISVNTVDQMHQLGAKIGAQLKPSDVVYRYKNGPLFLGGHF